ncbi:MAG: succinate dehydrogenase assembly factor 2 [Gallionellaceae bacterium]|nr:succinate dehydrogenase assembly factor 2 [Gallionellaceae bacterium]
MTHDAVEVARMRWRCRRGLLELDIVLGRFVEQRYATLSEAQKIDFDILLDLSDNALWDSIAGKVPVEDVAKKTLVNLINEL